MKKLKKRSPQRIAWLVSFCVDKITDGCLTAPNFFSDLWLRHLAVTLDFGNYVFPVHASIITVSRYLSTLFRYQFPLCS